MARFEIFQDVEGRYGWRLKLANGELVARSAETYATKEGARRAIDAVRASAQAAEVTKLA